jgi:hypothetical protein
VHEAAEQFLALDEAKKRVACIHLCELALAVWESNFPDGRQVTYQESVAGSSQSLDYQLPREALAAVRVGTDAAAIGQRYLEPIAALQDEDLVLPETAQFAYYAIYNVFQRYVRERKIDEWTIVNQALASTGTSDPGSVLSEVLRNVD